jgi:uncharacterized membrane protein YhaH (DUF805 family)
MTLPPQPPLPSEPPLWAPYYGASIGSAFARFWKKYATFSGRASRSEFWWWELIYAIVLVVLDFLVTGVTLTPAAQSDGAAGTFNPAYFAVNALIWVVTLASLVPTLALVWRRLHDTNRSGGFYFMGFIPLAGPIILLVFLASPPDPAGVRFDQPGA